MRQPLLNIAYLLFGFLLLVKGAHGVETCYIDNAPLFLYKTINWWYNSSPEESQLLCGKPIKCTHEGSAQFEYDEVNERIELKIKGGFASMLLPFKKCKQCYGPSRFHCTWLDQKYFNKARASVVLNGSGDIEGFAFDQIKKEKAELIRRMVPNLRFEMAGVIGGLDSGRVALHASGRLLKKCRQTPQVHEDAYPITLKIINHENNEILARFKMVWEP